MISERIRVGGIWRKWELGWKGDTESNWNASVIQNLFIKIAYVFNNAAADLK